MSLDPNKTYLVWNGTTFPNSSNAKFKAPAGSTIDWGDGTIESFTTESTEVNTHTYTDGITEHTIVISGLTSIGYSAFRNCSSLTSITIPDSVTSIGNYAFSYCSSLTSITIPDSVTSIGWNAFEYCTSLISVTIPNSVTNINSSMFRNCSSLTSVKIPNSVTRIDNSAFRDCTSLKSITIPNNVTSISDYLFQSCHSLTNIVIPDSVTKIGFQAFYNCYGLKTIVLLPETPPILSYTNAIPTKTIIYVQQSSKEAYKTATNWTTFADKIESNDIYLSFIRFNKKNKEYIAQQIQALKEYIDGRL